MKVIVISGPSGSGKTTLSNIILGKIKNGIILNTDNYYKTGIISNLLSKFVKGYFDRKISFNYKVFQKDFNFIINNGKLKHSYFYDFEKKIIRKYLIERNNLEVLIIEGIFAKESLGDFNPSNCFFIEMKISKDNCMNRAIRRDINERGKNKEEAEINFLNSWKYYYEKNKNSRNKIRNEFTYSKKKDLKIVLKKILNLKN
tara:strand:+ start:962 stop:1564 length:603 start_codon:yes stop_codon:yes gene_type:complete